MSPLSPVYARLREAGLVAVVDRVADQHDVTSGVLLTITGRVSPAQAALFRALAAEGQDAAAIARLLGWGEAAVARVLGMPEPKPTPVPESVVRKKQRPALRDVLALREEIAALRAEQADMRAFVGKLYARFERLLSDGDIPATELVLAEVAAKHGTTVAALRGRSRSDAAVTARNEAAERLYDELKLSSVQIGRLLKRDHTTVLYHLRARKAAA